MGRTLVRPKLICITAVDNDEEIARTLSRMVAQRLAAGTPTCGDVVMGPLERNDFSICFPMEISYGKGTSNRAVYVKIPKANLYRQRERNIMPITTEDSAAGRNEYASLSYLQGVDLPGGGQVSFAEPLCFIEDYNAIITERIHGWDLLIDFRKQALKKKLLPFHVADRMETRLFLLGMVISAYHRQEGEEASYETGKVIGKIKKYCHLLENYRIAAGFLKSIDSGVKTSGPERFNVKMVKTFKGLDVRNILIDHQEKMYVLDPGKMKDDCPEADLARFIVTCRIIFWGSMMFFLRLAPDSNYEGCFLDGYYARQQRPNDQLLHLLIVKELLKHWYLAHIALDLKAWPSTLKTVLRANYINPFYKHQLSRELHEITASKRL